MKCAVRKRCLLIPFAAIKFIAQNHMQKP